MNKMKLVSIGARNLKGLSFDLNLKPATFIVGPNYVGKTARTDAIRLLLIGYLPELGKLASSTFGLASGKELEVYGVLEDSNGSPYIVARRWFLKGDSVKSEKDIPPFLEEVDLVETMLNADSWFGLTENERVNWVFKNVAVETALDREALFATVKTGVDNRMTIWAADEEIKVDPQAIPSFLKALREKVDENESDDGPFTPPDLVDSIFNLAAELGKSAKEQAVRMDKTISGLASLRASDLSSPDVRAIEVKIEAIKGEIETVRNERATAAADYTEARENKLRRARLVEALGGKAGLESSRKLAADRSDELATKLAALPPATPEELAAFRAEERDASNATGRHQSDLGHIENSISKNEADLRDLKGKTNCPYCGATGDGWQVTKEAEINSALAGLRIKKEQTVEQIAKVKTHAEGMKAKVDGLSRTLDSRFKLSNELRGFEERLRSIDTGLAGLAGKTEALAAIPPDDSGKVQAAYELAETSLRVKTEEIALLEAARKAGLGRENDRQRLAQAEKDREAARIEERIAKEAVETVRLVKSAMVAEAFQPILVAANEFAASLISTPLAYNPEKAAIGTWRGGVWVGHKTFSGVEQLVAFAAIQAAFAMRGTVRVMILDEMLRAQNTKKGLVFDDLVDACKDAVKRGLIDNFVGVIPGDPEDYASLAVGETPCQVISIE